MAAFDFDPRMPLVAAVDDLAARFEQARRVTRGQETLLPEHPDAPGQRYVALLTPGRMLMRQACPPPGTLPEALRAQVETIAPAKPTLNISVIALNEIPPLLADIERAIPFFGLLLGLAYLGHNVTVFEGHPSALSVGCADADLILVDGGMVPHLQRDWLYTAFTMGQAQRLLILKRSGALREYTK
jgi:hypothetical protein